MERVIGILKVNDGVYGVSDGRVCGGEFCGVSGVNDGNP